MGDTSQVSGAVEERIVGLEEAAAVRLRPRCRNPHPCVLWNEEDLWDRELKVSLWDCSSEWSELWNGEGLWPRHLTRLDLHASNLAIQCHHSTREPVRMASGFANMNEEMRSTSIQPILMLLEPSVLLQASLPINTNPSR